MASIARADQVGSLLRPQRLLDAREQRTTGAIDAAALRAVEDEEILALVAMQQESGIDLITDGELRRLSWIATAPGAEDAPITGFSLMEPDPEFSWIRGWRDASGQPVQRAFRQQAFVTQRIGKGRDIVSDEYGFLRQHANGRKKYTYPAPSYHRIYWHPEHSKNAYATVDDFLRDVRDFIREEVIERAIALGCDYVQLDAPNYGQFYTDDEVRAELEAAGHDLDAALVGDAEIDNDVFDGVTGVTRALHICRGNGPGGIWSATGGYDTLAPEVFPRLQHIDTLLLEYDTPRAGDFSPLRYVQPHQAVVLGLLTTKDGSLEDGALIEQRIREASEHVPLDRLALSPQCGFNSALQGNPLTAEQQEAKLRQVVDIARRVWDE
jgi:5-methyltetrahydropteroyltriglutamate--homocysteine methyltransferase